MSGNFSNLNKLSSFVSDKVSLYFFTQKKVSFTYSRCCNNYAMFIHDLVRVGNRENFDQNSLITMRLWSSSQDVSWTSKRPEFKFVPHQILMCVVTETFHIHFPENDLPFFIIITVSNHFLRCSCIFYFCCKLLNYITIPCRLTKIMCV